MRVTEGLELALFKLFLTLLGGAGYGGSEACMALFRQFLTLLGDAGYLEDLEQALFKPFLTCWEVQVTEGLALFELLLTLPGGAGYGGSGAGYIQAVLCRVE